MHIYQLIRFARVCSHVEDFNARDKCFTVRLLKQGLLIGIISLGRLFSKFYRRQYELILKFIDGLQSRLHHGLSEPEFYGDLVHKFKKIMGRSDFSE